MSKKHEITILLPCLNEENTLAYCLSDAKFFIKQNNINGKIVVANNGSSDNSKNIAIENKVECIDINKKGYGSTIINALKYIDSEYCIVADCDCSYDLKNIMSFIEKLRDGYDLVIGNRFSGNIEKGAMPLTHKFIGTPVISYIGRKIYKNNIGDYNCGLRAFNTKKIKQLNLKCNGMEFASELIIKASKKSYKITEVPISFRKDKRNGKGHLKPWKDGVNHLRILLGNK